MAERTTSCPKAHRICCPHCGGQRDTSATRCETCDGAGQVWAFTLAEWATARAYVRELESSVPPKVGPATCRTCGDELITEVPATGDGQCIDCWQSELNKGGGR